MAYSKRLPAAQCQLLVPVTRHQHAEASAYKRLYGAFNTASAIHRRDVFVL
jgi:hypothetical protein